MNYSGRVATAIIVFSEHKILLVKRLSVPFKGYWALPGGKADVGETVEQAVVREVKEETGLDVKTVRKIGEYHENGVQGGIDYDYYTACFLAKPVGGRVKRQENEIEEVRPVDLKEIPETLAFEHANMIRDYRRTHNEGT